MLTVDASIWVAAADHTDIFYAQSRTFLNNAAHKHLRIYLPAFAWIEVACALSRRRRDALAGQQLAEELLNSPYIVQVQLEAPLLAQAMVSGTRTFLRGADALYAATAELNRTLLVSWDDELVRRANAITPADWLLANP
jgi:predicted nucleic acid-binding protein